MKRAQSIKYSLAALLFLTASVALSFANVHQTSALARSWTGGGDGLTFSDGQNWGTGVPQDGDTVTFDVSTLTSSKTLQNDLTGLQLDGITFTGALSGDNSWAYTISGNPITLSGNVTNTITGTNAGYATPSINTNLVLGANVSVSKVNLGNYDNSNTLNLSTYSLTVPAAGSCGTAIASNLSGTGSLIISGDPVSVTGTNTTYAGNISVTGRANIRATSFGTAAGTTTVSGSGRLAVINSTDVTLAEPFTLGGTGTFASNQNYYGGCGGSLPVAKTLTLTGGVTLTSDVAYNGENNLVVTEPFTANGHAFTVSSGVAGTVTTPSGSVEAPSETVQLDGDHDTQYETVQANQTAVLNGTRGGIGVSTKGTLKGTGTFEYGSIAPGGKIAPGNSPGTLTVLSDLTLYGTYEAEILNKDTYDKIIVATEPSSYDPLQLDSSTSTLSVILYDGWKVTQGDVFTIVDNRSNKPIEGTFSGLTEGAQLTVDGVTFSISYVGGDGNDVTLTALTSAVDPSAPNTGAMQFVRKNPALVAGLGIATAAVLFILAGRRRQTNN